MVNIQYSTNHVYLHRFSRLRFCVCVRNTFRVLNAFDFQTDFNLRFKRKRDIRFTLETLVSNETKTLVSNEIKPTKRSHITDQNFRKEANAKREFSVHAKRISNS